MSRLGIVYGILGLGVVGSVFIFGTKVYGATNWVSIAGIGFQPSELAKIIFVFFVAAMLYKNTSLKQIIITSVIAAVHVLMLVVEKDLGAAVIFFVTYIVMLYVGITQGDVAASGSCSRQRGFCGGVPSFCSCQTKSDRMEGSVGKL